MLNHSERYVRISSEQPERQFRKCPTTKSLFQFRNRLFYLSNLQVHYILYTGKKQSQILVERLQMMKIGNTWNCLLAYVIMPVGKNDESAHCGTQKSSVFPHRGFLYEKSIKGGHRPNLPLMLFTYIPIFLST